MADDENKIPDASQDGKLSFSISVPGVVSKNTDGTWVQSGPVSYLRLGSTEASAEGKLPDPDSLSKNDGSDKSSPKQPDSIPSGILLQSTGSYALNVPSVQQWSGDSITVISNGKQVYSANYTHSGLVPVIDPPASISFQRQNNLTTLMGVNSTFVTGQALSYWNGNDASLGFGGLLWSNYGSTLNLFGGQIVNLTNWDAEIQGWGSYKQVTDFSVGTTSRIRFAVNPDNATAIADAATVSKAMNATTLAIASIVGGLAVASDVEANVAGALTSNVDTLRANLIAMNAELGTATGLVDAIQALAVLQAALLKAKKIADPLADEGSPVFLMSPAEVILKYGPESYLAMEPFSIVLASPVLTIVSQAYTESPGPITPMTV